MAEGTIIGKTGFSILKKVNSLASLVNMFAGEDPVRASLVPLDDDGNELDKSERSFQYFPSQINDSKSVNYAVRAIPGGSHPLYQFINGNDRIISFDAMFTSDENPDPQTLVSTLAGGLDINLSNMAAKKFLDKTKKHVAPVDSAVIWLRSFMYPSYSDNGGMIPPPTLRLYLPNSKIHGSTSSGGLILDSVDVLMTQCDVTYDTFYRNGRQRITAVRLSFYETIQVGDNWKFTDASFFTEAWMTGRTAADIIEPYNLKTNRSKEGALSKANKKFKII